MFVLVLLVFPTFRDTQVQAESAGLDISQRRADCSIVPCFVA